VAEPQVFDPSIRWVSRRRADRADHLGDLVGASAPAPKPLDVLKLRGPVVSGIATYSRVVERQAGAERNESELCRGRTVVDLWRRRGREPNVHVAVGTTARA